MSSTRREQHKRRAKAEVPDYIAQKQQKYDEAKWDRSPIKQYIRRYGWLQIIEDYIERRRNDGVERPLKFLTLPGANALDIGLWWKTGVLKKREEDGPLNVAICDVENAEVVTAHLSDLGGVLAYTNEWLHNALRDKKGQLRDHFPFDVINMDICGSLISRKKKTNLDALDRIFRLQQGQGFLLLLTTKPDVDARDRLIPILQGNLTEEQFREVYEAKYDDLELHELYDRDYVVFNQLVTPKAVARWGRDFGYKTYEHFVANYLRKEDDIEYWMICHSFEFEPIRPRKPSNKYQPQFRYITEDNIEHVLNDELSNTIRSSALSAYTDFAVSVVNRDPVDVNAILDDDPDLYAELESEAETLIDPPWWENA